MGSEAGNGGRMKGISEPIVAGTVIAGTLDLSAAFLSAWITSGRTAGSVLRGIASGPFGDVVRDGGPLAAMAGPVVHYGIIAGSAVVYVFPVRAATGPSPHPLPLRLPFG